MTDSQQAAKGLSEKKVHQILERGWETGGFRFIFETFNDLITNQEANDIASEFVKDLIRAVVRDEKTAENLLPDYALFAKRPPLGHYYFETFNKPHVELVNVSRTRIKSPKPAVASWSLAQLKVFMLSFTYLLTLSPFLSGQE